MRLWKLHRQPRYIEAGNAGLMGKGLGFIDAHLSASAILTKVPMWTLDKKLDEINKKLNINYL